MSGKRGPVAGRDGAGATETADVADGDGRTGPPVTETLAEGPAPVMTTAVPERNETSVIVCLGPGGVGKTTTAAALAMLGAKNGLRACVVTVDPARRLADALGVADVGNEPHLVGPPPGAEAWEGELWAVMLDAQSTFNELVDRYATDAEQAKAIFSNPVYRNMSGGLSGTQEYMAVEKLYELQETGRFDLIVVDTPPSQHALDFLEAPSHLARLLDNRVFRLLMTPTRLGLRAVELGAQLMLRTIAKVAGGQVVADTVQFFTEFEGMQQGFRERAERAQALLRSDRTSFALVCTPRRDTVDDALYLVTQLAGAGAKVSTVVANRCYPRYTPIGAQARSQMAGTPLEPLVVNLDELALVSSKEDAQLARLADALPSADIKRVPFLAREVSDVVALVDVAGYLEEQASPPADAGHFADARVGEPLEPEPDASV